MAFTPISNTVPQYEENGVAASGYFIKFYESGTTTPTAMATDSTGTTLLDKCELNTEGYPINGSSAVFIPHIDKKYKIALFRNAADADANDLASAAWPAVDGLFPVAIVKAAYIEGVDSVADLEGFVAEQDDQQISLKGWHPDSDVGGGILYWDAAKPKSEHNGGTIFSPTVPFSATTGDYIDGAGETDVGGSGCWVRVKNPVRNPLSITNASVETLMTFHSNGEFQPANKLDYDSGGTMSGGGIKNQWNVTCTSGAKDGHTAVSTDAAMTGAGTDKWSCTINYGDGNYQFNVVTSISANTFSFLYPLDADATGAIVSMLHDGIHMTRLSTEAYINKIADRPAFECIAREFVECNSFASPPKYNKTWKSNSAVLSYGASNVNNIISNFQAETAASNVLTVSTGYITRPVSDPCGVIQGCHLAGHGVEAVIDTAKVPSGFIEFSVCVDQTYAGSPVLPPEYTATITATDGINTLYSGTAREMNSRVVIPFDGIDKIYITVVSDQDGEFYLGLRETKVWQSQMITTPIFNENERTVLCGDSWFAWYDQGAGRFLNERIARKSGTGEVITSALGGMTTQWALDNFDSLIKDKNPDHVMFNFFTNDANLVGSFETWKNNLELLVNKCNSIGIRTTVIRPFTGGNQTLYKWNAQWDVKRASSLYTATTVELSDVLSAHNVHGKYKGKTINVGANTFYASGEDAADKWLNSNTDRITNLEALVYDYTSKDAADFKIGNGVVGGLSSGITLQESGDNTNNTFTPSITPENYQQLLSNFGTPESAGLNRLQFNSASVGADSDSYMCILQLRGSDVSSSVEVFSDFAGGAAFIVSDNILGTTSTDVNGDFDYARRMTVTQNNFYLSVIATVDRSTLPTSATTKVKNCWMINLTKAEIAFGLKFSEMSDLEVYNVLLPALESAAPNYIRLTDIGDGGVKRIQINNGVLEVV